VLRTPVLSCPSYRRLSSQFHFSLSGVTLVYLSQWGKSRMPGNAEAGEVEYGVGLDVSLEALAVHGCETFFFQLP
jgi:hypothetical protein